MIPPRLDLLAAGDQVVEVRTYPDGRVMVGPVMSAEELWKRWKENSAPEEGIC